MKLHLVLALCLSLLVSAQVVGQNWDQSTLVNEVGETGCEDYGARVDVWLAAVDEKPDQIGYAIVRGPVDQLLKRITYREWIYGQVLFRFGDKLDRNRYILIDGENAPALTVQFYKTTPDQREKLTDRKKWDLSLPLEKPFAYYRSGEDGGVCPFLNYVKVFSELLLANPTVRGHIVIYEMTNGKFIKRKEEFAKELSHIPTRRLRFFHGKSYYDGHFELWLVPQKTRLNALPSILH
jgi:hypothetical protein